MALRIGRKANNMYQARVGANTIRPNQNLGFRAVFWSLARTRRNEDAPAPLPLRAGLRTFELIQRLLTLLAKWGQKAPHNGLRWTPVGGKERPDYLSPRLLHGVQELLVRLFHVCLYCLQRLGCVDLLLPHIGQHWADRPRKITPEPRTLTVELTQLPNAAVVRPHGHLVASALFE